MKIPKVGTRVIRVNSCADCPYCRFDGEVKTGDCYYCYWAISIKVDSYVKKAILPDNCPLEKLPESAFGFLNDEGEDIYTGTEGELITFTNENRQS